LDFGVGVGERFVFVGSNPFARFFVPHDFSIGRTPPSKVGWIIFVLHQSGALVVGGYGGSRLEQLGGGLGTYQVEASSMNQKF